MLTVLSRNWWMWLIRGIAAVIFGILAWLWPGLTWITIAILFGAYAFVDGIFAIYGTIRAAETHQRWWPFLLEGIVGILIAAITFYDVRITITALYLTIAVWAFLTGIFELVAAVQIRKHLANEVWLIVGGLASIAFGVLMILYPIIAAITIIYIIAAYAIFFGIIMIGFSLRLRKHAQTPTAAATT
ncbi:MAG: DUF308 domain-containing protein [Candidatus Eremiobacteraeota bacterium]|nr:DUF308 domain-containing protein [Candidatus Eremiobacteraeota bacterium]